jgi:hypothetical protein
MLEAHEGGGVGRNRTFHTCQVPMTRGLRHAGVVIAFTRCQPGCSGVAQTFWRDDSRPARDRGAASEAPFVFVLGGPLGGPL